tara:strand:- start:435 stop:1013 length:579 start_codon:yes stop_codon:yes gene_type:complete
MKVKLVIPDNWNDITIDTYQKYLLIQESRKKEKTKIIDSVALLCNTTKEVVKKMDYRDLLEIMSILKKMVDSEPEKKDFKKTFKLENEEYGFIPNLSKLTTGEYIDLETYCKTPIKNLHTIMSILYRKITFKRGNRYAIENYNPDEFKEEVFRECPMGIALGSLGFFLTLGDKLLVISDNYLKNQEMKQQAV